MDPKITMFFMLMAAIIGLSHLREDTVARVRDQFDPRRLRNLVPSRRKF